MDEPKKLPSEEDLDARLQRAQDREEKLRQGSDKPRSSALGQAMRVGIELVAGVAVGSLIGYLLDHWLGTRPWLMIVFFFLGSGAGMMNVYRVAGATGGSFGKQRSGDEPDGEA
jgi:ATP synthase protein I